MIVVEDLEPLYLDCCAVLNVYATRRFGEILVANGGGNGRRLVVAQRVVTYEALYVRNVEGDDVEREAVDLQAAIDAGVLSVERLESDVEAATFVELAIGLDDGEAETGALAHHRGGSVATDDVAAIRALTRLVPPVRVVRTSSMMKRWADRGRIDAAVVRQALIDIRQRARFVPPPSDPLSGWWMSAAA